MENYLSERGSKRERERSFDTWTKWHTAQKREREMPVGAAVWLAFNTVVQEDSAQVKRKNIRHEQMLVKRELLLSFPSPLNHSSKH